MAGAAGVAVGVAVLDPESPALDLVESDDDPESLDEVVLDEDDDDFALPPRLSVL